MFMVNEIIVIVKDFKKDVGAKHLDQSRGYGLVVSNKDRKGFSSFLSQ